jgi:hypothetical protein
MMIQANIPYKVHYCLFKDAYKTAVILDGFTVMTIEGKTDTHYVHWCGKNPKFTNHLRTWGEAGTVKIKAMNTPKLADRGVQCVFIGYSLEHSSVTYKMWDPKTGGVHTSRDIIWLRRMYYQAQDPHDNYVEVNEENTTLEAEEGEEQESNESSSESESETDDDNNDNDDSNDDPNKNKAMTT